MMTRKCPLFTFTTACATALGFVAMPALADSHGHVQHGAHVHGEATLNVVLEGRQLLIELISPAANIVGFEHPPHDPDQHQRVEAVAALLDDAEALFAPSAAAACRAGDREVHSPFADDHEVETPVEDRDRHAHDAHAEHEHHDSGHVHSDYEATYSFDCKHPGALETLSLPILKTFPGIEHVTVNYIVNGRQGAVEASAHSASVRFGRVVD